MYVGVCVCIYVCVVYLCVLINDRSTSESVLSDWGFDVAAYILPS